MIQHPRLENADKKYWAPFDRVLTWVEERVKKNSKVLEIGPGNVKFSLADTFVGWLEWDSVANENWIRCDIQKDFLPFSDNEFDFVYCRHVLEDIYNPFQICREMSRVAKAGYIETPSPISEMCRGVDAGSPGWRGYIHHRYFVWNDKGTLRFMTKYPVVDHLNFGDLENVIVDVLKENPILWNTYFAWEDEITFEYYQHEVDYHLINGQLEKWYGEMVVESIDQSYKSGLEFAKNLQA